MADKQRFTTLSGPQMIWPVLAGLVTQCLVIVTARLAARLTRPSGGGGLEGLSAAVFALVIGEPLAVLLCVIGAIVLALRNRRVQAWLLLAGWVLPVFCVTAPLVLF